MNKKSICFVSSGPDFDGGVSNYQKNLIRYIKSTKKDLNLTWVYKSHKNESEIKEGIKYVGLNGGKIPFLDDFIFNKKLLRYFRKNYFDIINSHAVGGYWMKNYKKIKNQKLINTCHGAGFNYYKTHLKRFGLIKKILLSPLLIYSYLIEKPPIKNADKIICVSEKVKNQIEEIYGKRKEIYVIRTGVNLNNFKKRNKKTIRKEIGLEEKKIYGLHVAKGGYWIKGLDRAVRISKEIYDENNNYRLIVIGSKYNKNKNFLNKKFIIPIEKISREKIPYYYNAADFFFCLSRYEGGAPTLVVSEAMASECLLVCSKDAQQEIIENEKNGIILNKFDKESSKKIIEILKDKNKKQKIIENSIKTIKNLSLEKWGKEYLDILMI